MRLCLALCLIAVAAMPIARTARAADEQVEKLFYETCMVNEAGWIGKDQKAVAANCACKA
jgi:hypothetical protein